MRNITVILNLSLTENYITKKENHHSNEYKIDNSCRVHDFSVALPLSPSKGSATRPPFAASEPAWEITVISLA